MTKYEAVYVCPLVDGWPTAPMACRGHQVENGTYDVALHQAETYHQLDPIGQAQRARPIRLRQGRAAALAHAARQTQPLTLPHLSQFGGVAKAGGRILAAAKIAASGKAEGALADALTR